MAKVKVDTYNSLDEAIKDGYVLATNTSDAGGSRPKGELIIQVKTADDTNVLITLPPTWIPIDLTNFATLEDLNKCSALRSYVARQNVRLLKRASVEQLKKEPSYATEANRIRAKQERYNQSIAGIESESVELNIGTVSASKASANPDFDQSASHNPYADQIVEADDNQQIVDILNANINNISVPDMQYLIAMSENGSFLNSIALELEGYLTTDGKLPFTSVEETGAVQMARSNGTFDSVNVSY